MDAASDVRGLSEPRHEKKRIFAYAKTKAQISFTVTVKLISTFVFTTRIVQFFFFFLNPKFQVSSHLLSLYSSVCVRPGRKPQRAVFSRRGLSHNVTGGNTAIIHLYIGEAMWLESYLASDSQLHSNPYFRVTTFSGVLLYT